MQDDRSRCSWLIIIPRIVVLTLLRIHSEWNASVCVTVGAKTVDYICERTNIGGNSILGGNTVQVSDRP